MSQPCQLKSLTDSQGHQGDSRGHSSNLEGIPCKAAQTFSANDLIFLTTSQNFPLEQYRYIGLDHLNFKHMAPPENKNIRGSDYL